MSGTLDFVLLHVEDIAAARAFYTEKLGFTVKDENPTFIQFATDGGAIFALSKETPATPTSTVELWWQVADVDATHAGLVAQHVEITSEPHDLPFGRTFAVKDPAGNVVNFYKSSQR